MNCLGLFLFLLLFATRCENYHTRSLFKRKLMSGTCSCQTGTLMACSAPFFIVTLKTWEVRNQALWRKEISRSLKRLLLSWGYWNSGKDKAIASSELLPSCWIESHFQPFHSVEEIFLKKKWRKRGLLNASFVIYVLLTDGWETILNLQQTTFAILNLSLLVIVVKKRVRNGTPKWKMSHTEAFKLNSWFEILS